MFKGWAMVCWVRLPLLSPIEPYVIVRFSRSLLLPQLLWVLPPAGPRRTPTICRRLFWQYCWICALVLRGLQASGGERERDWLQRQVVQIAHRVRRPVGSLAAGGRLPRPLVAIGVDHRSRRDAIQPAQQVAAVRRLLVRRVNVAVGHSWRCLHVRTQSVRFACHAIHSVVCRKG